MLQEQRLHLFLEQRSHRNQFRQEITYTVIPYWAQNKHRGKLVEGGLMDPVWKTQMAFEVTRVCKQATKLPVHHFFISWWAHHSYTKTGPEVWLGRMWIREEWFFEWPPTPDLASAMLLSLSGPVWFISWPLFCTRTILFPLSSHLLSPSLISRGLV